MAEPQITLSVVSHGQNRLVNQLLGDLGAHCAGQVALVLTQNIPDSALLEVEACCAPAQVVHNATRKGFGANHNAAFARCQTPFFCIANPDIRLQSSPFPNLLDALGPSVAGVAGPLVLSPQGVPEDSARRFPTWGALVRKLFVETRQPDYPIDRGTMDVHWCAGMFLLFKSEAFRRVGGFDEEYFLYYEDVDICRRLMALGWSTRFEPRAKVIHDARRASRRNPALAIHHLRSAARFLSR
jgi:N-acetylglucosaminyl-diphospho-decaprenol L-rhamnosyltransferase